MIRSIEYDASVSEDEEPLVVESIVDAIQEKLEQHFPEFIQTSRDFRGGRLIQLNHRRDRFMDILRVVPNHRECSVEITSSKSEPPDYSDAMFLGFVFSVLINIPVAFVMVGIAYFGGLDLVGFVSGTPSSWLTSCLSIGVVALIMLLVLCTFFAWRCRFEKIEFRALLLIRDMLRHADFSKYLRIMTEANNQTGHTFCPSCGERCEEKYKFCISCGQKLSPNDKYGSRESPVESDREDRQEAESLNGQAKRKEPKHRDRLRQAESRPKQVASESVSEQTSAVEGFPCPRCEDMQCRDVDSVFESACVCPRCRRIYVDRSGIPLKDRAEDLQNSGDFSGALELYKEEEQILRQLNNLEGLQFCLGNQGDILYEQGELDEALALRQEEGQICRQLRNKDWLQVSLYWQGRINKDLGNLDRAKPLLEEQEQNCRELGNNEWLHHSLCVQGNTCYLREEYERGIELHKEAERICRELGDTEGIDRALKNQALGIEALDPESGQGARSEEAPNQAVPSWQSESRANEGEDEETPAAILVSRYEYIRNPTNEDLRSAIDETYDDFLSMSHRDYRDDEDPCAWLTYTCVDGREYCINLGRGGDLILEQWTSDHEELDADSSMRDVPRDYTLQLLTWLANGEIDKIMTQPWTRDEFVDDEDKHAEDVVDVLSYKPSISYESLLAELVSIGRRESSYMNYQDEVRQIGKQLNEIGGYDLMVQANEAIRRQLGGAHAREIEYYWSGIGEWRG